MPIYEFECSSCGSQFELLRSFSETSAPNCPTCNSDHVERQMGRPAIHFKGSGWYINDSKKASKTSANGTNGDAGKDAGSSDGSDGKKAADSGKSTDSSATGTKETAKVEAS
ncbi:MAG: zinc ribbon domain-containing protein [Caldilineaceae bacterium]|nr:zinc ribbon domain-containing protein [Caldilineaceae bacterium]